MSFVCDNLLLPISIHKSQSVEHQWESERSIALYTQQLLVRLEVWLFHFEHGDIWDIGSRGDTSHGQHPTGIRKASLVIS